MSEREAGPYDSVARKWLALVERRQENFIDICNSGRWRQYYTRAEIIDEMRKVLRLRDQWAINAGLPPSGEDESLPLWASSLDKVYDESRPSELSPGMLARRGRARLDRAGVGQTGQKASGTLSTSFTRGLAEHALSAAFPGFFHPAEKL